MRILLTGATGQVGFELQRTLALFGQVDAPDRAQLDLLDKAAVASWLERYQPELIVNAAAYTAVDTAESEPEMAWRMNAELPEQLAAHAAANGIKLVHYSSDYVYPGKGSAPMPECTETAPLSIYGQSKLAGDNAITRSGTSHLIFRTSWVYSAHGGNFMKTMLRLAQERNQLKVVSDQHGSPTPARLIAEATGFSLLKEIPDGIYHLAPRGETSWYDFAKQIIRLAERHGCSTKARPDTIMPLTTEQYPTAAQRPLNSRLDISRLETALGIRLPDWDQQLELTFKELIAKSS